MAVRMRTLLLDNYDSYTYNLFQLLASVDGVEPLVLHNDAITLEGVQALLAAGDVHAIVISPGPGSPDKKGDIGVCMEVLQHLEHVPILGVCLGHQALAVAAGGHVLRAPEPVHGRLSELQHTGHPLLAGIPSGPGQGFEVVRYHSLIVDEATLPGCLEPVAWTCGAHHAIDLGPRQHQVAAAPASNMHQPTISGKWCATVIEPGCLLMAMAHRTRPHYGVQFHPESICTKHGTTLLSNFKALALTHLGMASTSWKRIVAADALGQAMLPKPWPSVPKPCVPCSMAVSLMWQVCRGCMPLGDTSFSQVLFEQLLSWQPYTFWLDSAAADRGRFSFMGGRGGPLWRCITYRLPPPSLTPLPAPGSRAPTSSLSQPPPVGQQMPMGAAPSAVCGTVRVEDAAGKVEELRQPFFEFLRQLLARHQLVDAQNAADQLPFNFWGGLVGYLGYELKAECGGALTHAATTPDAALLFADRLLVVDHQQGDVYVLALAGQGQEAALEAKHWTDDMAVRVQAIVQAKRLPMHQPQTPPHAPPRTPPYAPRAPPQASSSHAESGLPSQKAKQQECAPHSEPVPEFRQGEAESFCSGPLHSLRAFPEQDCVSTPKLSQESTHQEGPPDSQQQHDQLCNGASHQGPPGCRLQGQPQSDALQEAANGHHLEPQRCRPGLVPPPFRLHHNRPQYLDNVAGCLSALHAGESYEVCLTTALARHGSPAPGALYAALRVVNPAPYSAWLNFGHSGPAVCCSSPERFLHGGRGGLLEARPIKGTAARHRDDPARDAQAAVDLADSEKDRAENLMIVDLLRHDLGGVCEVGSVHVPGLMEIESYATVHQMVSTVRGLRRAGTSMVDAIQAAFPAGSMTGAPKVRTMAIIDTLEGRARGVYSGCVGFMSLNECFDLNVVIRTAVIEPPQPTTPAAASLVSQPELQQPIQTACRAPVAQAQAGALQPGLQHPSQVVGRTPVASQESPAGPSLMHSLLAHEREPDWSRALLTVGAGGAVVVQSGPVEEYEEMRLKARALLTAVGRCDAVAGAGASQAAVDDQSQWEV